MMFRMMYLVVPCILAGSALAEVDHWFTIKLAGTPAGTSSNALRPGSRGFD
mgnify:CR=1 FL=1